MSGISKKIKYLILGGLFSLGLLLGFGAGYLSDYYRADREAIEAFGAELSISGEEVEKGCRVYDPGDASTGLIFYPGGKVEYTAYEPLMLALAEEGIFCVLLEMPGNLAVLDVDAAEGIPARYPAIESWYLAGHSLGGSMAAGYLAEAEESYAGLILLGSYSTADLSARELAVLSLYGSEDGVMNREKYEENRKNLPQDLSEVVLEGACHAGFGMYGPQKGDGVPGMSTRQQLTETAILIAEFIRK